MAGAPDIEKTVLHVEALLACNLVSPAAPGTCPDVRVLHACVNERAFMAIAVLTDIVALLDANL